MKDIDWLAIVKPVLAVGAGITLVFAGEKEFGFTLIGFGVGLPFPNKKAK